MIETKLNLWGAAIARDSSLFCLLLHEKITEMFKKQCSPEKDWNWDLHISPSAAFNTIKGRILGFTWLSKLTNHSFRLFSYHLRGILNKAFFKHLILFLKMTFCLLARDWWSVQGAQSAADPCDPPQEKVGTDNGWTEHSARANFNCICRLFL